MKRKSRLILALDETDPSRALEVAREVGDLVDAVKVNYPLVLSAGMGVVDDIGDFADVICDFKVADIPNTSRMIVEEARRHGASGVICHGFVGRDTVKACVDAMRGGDVFVVTEMSHPGGLEFTRPHGLDLARVAVDAGAHGVIAPATRPERVRLVREVVGDMLILSPGVGAQGGRAADAIVAGADYVIVGRSIYRSVDPRGAAESLVEEIKEATRG
ncbi:MAG: orotidine-5'-phosphate decarboxylase [Thermoplasmata archaeon]|nr:orotidine-5'-phosphate decarboxylase [Thermoplasmata archaeon]